MSGSSNTVVATVTLSSGSTIIANPVSASISGLIANSGTPTISTAMYAPVGVGVTITNTSTIAITGSATQDRVRTGPFYSINYNEGIGLDIVGTLSTVINTGSILSETTLLVPGALQSYFVYGIGLSVQAGKAVNNQGALISGSGDGAYLLASTMSNEGIVAGHQGAGSTGVLMQASGLYNGQTGLIEGAQYGVYERTFAVNGHYYGSTVLNQGVIGATGLNGRGVGALVNGGPLTNGSLGTLVGFGSGNVLGYGAVIGDGATLTNAGKITVAGAGIGVFITNGTFVEQAGGQTDGVKVGFKLHSGTLVNDGTITPQITNVSAVVLGAGYATNSSSGVIQAPTSGVAIGYYSTASALLNEGTITQTATNTGSAITLYRGAFANTLGGTVTGYDGIITSTLGVTIANAGLIGADGSHGIGVSLTAGSLINEGGIGGVTAIAVGGTGSVNITDSGVIASALSSAGTALIDATGTLSLTLDPGATIIGSVSVDAATPNDLILAAATPSPSPSPATGTVGGLGQDITGFSSISFAQGATWSLIGDQAGLASGQTITGFSVGDTLVLDGFAATSDSYVSGVGLELGNATGSVTLDLVGNFTTNDFSVIDPPGNTTIALASPLPCFVSGTHILTPHGPRAVEALAPGDLVIRHDGAAVPIIWHGKRRIDTSRHTAPERVWPVLIEADAIAEGVPSRDLLLSPDHALYLEFCLIPAKTLLNGRSIRRLRRRFVTYHHLELAEHAAIYAEQCLTESYLDTGNRSCFTGGAAVSLHPVFDQNRRERSGFAPLHEAGPVVQAVRARLLARAAIATLDDPCLRIIRRADGTVCIASRSAIPGLLSVDPRDHRRLGVKLRALRIGGARLALDHPLLTEGWHHPEPDGRWTDGAALIPAALVRGQPVSVDLAATLPYPATRKFG